jgi:rubrerythrin
MGPWPERHPGKKGGAVSDKPSYLGLLNAISLAETRAHCYYTAWIETSDNDDVKAVLSTVAVREGEHGMAFAKRVNELGFSLRDKDDPNFARQMELVRSDRSDLDKMEALGVGRLDSPTDLFDKVFKDHSIDIRTGELLGRYVAEERDSARLLRCCYEQLKSCEAADATSPVTDRLMALDAKVDALCEAVDSLRQLVGATAAPADGTAAKSARRRDN